MKLQADLKEFYLTAFFLMALTYANITIAGPPMIDGNKVLLPPFYGLSTDQHQFNEHTFGSNLILSSSTVEGNDGFITETAILQQSAVLIPASGTCFDAVNLRVPVHFSVPGKYKVQIHFTNIAFLYAIKQSILISAGGYDAIHGVQPRLYYRGEKQTVGIGQLEKFWDINKSRFRDGFSESAISGILALPEVYAMIKSGGTTAILKGVKAAKAFHDIYSFIDNYVPDESTPNVCYSVEMVFNIKNTGTYDISLLSYNQLGLESVGAVYCFRAVLSQSNITINQINVELIEIDGHTVVASASSNGSISPSGPVLVYYGEEKSFTATPNSGYEVDSWVANYHSSGNSSTIQTGGNICTIPSVTQDMTLTVYFKQVSGPPPFGDLEVIRPASSPYETGRHDPTFEFRVPDGTTRVGWRNTTLNTTEKNINYNNRRWQGSVYVEDGHNDLFFVAYDSNNNALASTSFVVIKVNNMRTVYVNSSSAYWASVWQAYPNSGRSSSSGTWIGRYHSPTSGKYGWEQAFVRFDIPTLPARVPNSTISAEMRALLRIGMSEGYGDCMITVAAIHDSWAHDITTVTWNTRPQYYITGTNHQVNVFWGSDNQNRDAYVFFDASQSVKYWVDGVTNKGFWLWASGNPFEGGPYATDDYYRYFHGTGFRLQIQYEYNTNPPSLSITSPENEHSVTYETESITVSGTASNNSNSSLSSVTWSNTTTGTSGTANGPTSWNFNVGLAVGSNRIVVTAKDVVDNTTSQVLFIYRAELDTSPPALPGNCSTTPLRNAMNLSWQNPTNNYFDGVLVLRSLEPIIMRPTDGFDYSTGDTIGNAVVIYSGLEETLEDSELTPFLQYHYAIYAFNEFLNYSEGVLLFGVPLPQPDLTGDRWVKYDDFFILASKWSLSDCNGENNWCEGADLNRDGRVNLFDLINFAGEWLSYDPIYYSLSASVIGGNGSVAPTGGFYPEGTVVGLSASPNTGYRVKKWLGTNNNSSISNSNSVTMNADKTVTVEFERFHTISGNVHGGMPGWIWQDRYAVFFQGDTFGYVWAYSNYNIQVPEGWSGIVFPYSQSQIWKPIFPPMLFEPSSDFEPSSRSYSNIQGSFTSQNFTYTPPQ